MINNKFKGYTYTEYQNEMCDKAIESCEREIDLLLTGYGSEKTYHYLMDIFTENTKED